MNWFRENRFLGTFLVACGLCTLGAIWFFFSAKSDRDEASARFSNASAELNRLERLAPYPSAENLRKMNAHAEDYASALAKLKDALNMRAAPVAPMAPNEFQSHLRVAMNAVAERARANRVKLPDKFYLGFDEFASALPNESAAPLLGEELLEIEWLVNGLLDAHVESLTAFRRAPLKEERATGALPTATPATPAKPAPGAPLASNLFERNAVELTFLSTPAVARKVINQIAGANQQFCIVRLLRVRNEKEKGPPREAGGEPSAPSIPSPSPAAKAPAAALNFIVGNEKIETTAKVEIVRFTF
ncbi:MAG TPA: Amuc_1100 family pilus-like protein [Chthoniobacterales bacterium]|nr:Amuc_1100 family pilus-like protein [Chthoniobacterales bacterium]